MNAQLLSLFGLSHAQIRRDPWFKNAGWYVDGKLLGVGDIDGNDVKRIKSVMFDLDIECERFLIIHERDFADVLHHAADTKILDFQNIFYDALAISNDDVTVLVSGDPLYDWEIDGEPLEYQMTKDFFVDLAKDEVIAIHADFGGSLVLDLLRQKLANLPWWRFFARRKAKSDLDFMIKILGSIEGQADGKNLQQALEDHGYGGQ